MCANAERPFLIPPHPPWDCFWDNCPINRPGHGQSRHHPLAHPSIAEAKKPLPMAIVQTAIADETNQTLKKILKHLESQIPKGKTQSISIPLKGANSTTPTDIIFNSTQPTRYQTYRDGTKLMIVDFKEAKMWNYPSGTLGRLPGRNVFTVIVDNDGPGSVKWTIGDDVSSQTSDFNTGPDDVFRLGFDYPCIQRINLIAPDADAHVDVMFVF